MNKYSFVLDPRSGKIQTVKRDEVFIPIDLDNRDYVQFLKDWEAGATVLSSTGSPLPWGSDPS
jgi:hypothetical protein